MGTGTGTGTGIDNGSGATLGDMVATVARLLVTLAGGTGNGTGTGTGTTDIAAGGTGEDAGTVEEGYKTLFDCSALDDDCSAFQSNDVGTTWRTLPTRTT